VKKSKVKSVGQECPTHNKSAKSSHFSFPFHKEVSSSTVFAQLNTNFPLRAIGYSRKVLTVQREMH